MSGRCGARWRVYRDKVDGGWRAECRTHWDHEAFFYTWQQAFDYADRMTRADR